jgi:hypothetical protein
LGFEVERRLGGFVRGPLRCEGVGEGCVRIGGAGRLGGEVRSIGAVEVASAGRSEGREIREFSVEFRANGGKEKSSLCSGWGKWEIEWYF